MSAREYRVGNHWGVTIVREGTQPPDASGKRPDAELVAVVTNGDRRLAQRICDLLNADDVARPPDRQQLCTSRRNPLTPCVDCGSPALCGEAHCQPHLPEGGWL